MAPELLEGKPYNTKVDVYAFGVMLNEMLSRQVPFAGITPAEVKQQVLTGQRPHMELSYPKNLADFIKLCWHADQAVRPSMEAAIEQLTAMSK